MSIGDCIKDFGLTASELEVKYEKKSTHPEPGLWRSDWRKTLTPEQIALDCDEDYWDWVVARLYEMEDALSKDNPYSQESYL